VFDQDVDVDRAPPTPPFSRPAIFFRFRSQILRTQECLRRSFGATLRVTMLARAPFPFLDVWSDWLLDLNKSESLYNPPQTPNQV